MNYKKYRMNNYDLHMIYSKRFKTIEIVVNLRFLGDKYSEVYVPLICKLLLNTTSKYDSILETNKACAKVYDPMYSIRPFGSGKEMVISLKTNFVNEKYTEIGMNEKSIDFVLPFLFEPKIVDGGFDKEIFEVEKEKLINNYMSIKDYPSDYADAMNDYYLDKKGYNGFSVDEAARFMRKITREDLYDYYLKILENSKLDVFVCGDFDFKAMKKIFEKRIIFNGVRKGKINHFIKQTCYRKIPKVVKERTNNVQSNLVIGCKVTAMTKFEREYVFPIYSWILGGSINSLLGRTVREENSLCYYIYASSDRLCSTLKIYSGINLDDYDKVMKFIDLEMGNIKTGKFSSSLIDNVKKLYCNSLDGLEDSQTDFLNNYISQTFLKIDDFKLREKFIKKVTKDDIMKFAHKIHVDTVFLLEGDAHE